MSLDSLTSIGRSTAWELTTATTVRADAGHPQGLARWADNWLVTTVHPQRGTGEVLVVSAEGEVTRRIDVTDGDRFHPGGLASGLPGTSIWWIAVAEYRPRSSTTVMCLDADLTTVTSFPFDDHLGAICPLSDGTLFAVSWGSRRWYRLDVAGQVLDQRPTPTRWVDLQDVARVDGQHVVATGVGELRTPHADVQIGGLVVIDVDEMMVVHDAPVAAWMPSGRVATYNGAHLDLGADTTESLRLSCIVDDTTANIATWVPRQPVH